MFDLREVLFELLGVGEDLADVIEIGKREGLCRRVFHLISDIWIGFEDRYVYIRDGFEFFIKNY